MRVVAWVFVLSPIVLVGMTPLLSLHVAGYPSNMASVAPFKEVPTRVCSPSCATGVMDGLSGPPGVPQSDAVLAPASSYDEQLGATFTQSFTSLAFNVTAVEQADSSSGQGPAYLLNGLSTVGYWYQVGVSWNWDPGTSLGTGFDMNYEVFNTQGQEVLPAGGGGGLQSFSGAVNDGDSILLNLYFNSGYVVMTVHDWDTGATATESYSAEGATSFEGDVSANANSRGFFTGLMTEWYHPTTYLSDEKEVIYMEDTPSLTSVWLWMDEFNPVNDVTVFVNDSAGPVSLVVNPSRLQGFASNGATEYVDAYEFITGVLNETVTVPLTFSYSVIGGGTGYSPPVVQYTSGGSEVTAALASSPTTFNVDNATEWTITSDLPGSGNGQRWETYQGTSGTVSDPGALSFTFYHQFALTLSYSVATGGATQGPPSGPSIEFMSFGTTQDQTVTTQPAAVWVDAGTPYSVSNPLAGSGAAARWVSDEVLAGNATSPLTVAPSYYQQFRVGLSYTAAGGDTLPAGAQPVLVGMTFGSHVVYPLSKNISYVWLDSGSSYSIPAIIGNSSITFPGGPAPDQRWEGNATSGTVDAQTAYVSVQYRQQFLVTFEVNAGSGGTLSEGGGWYDAGSEVHVSAIAKTGWKLEGWVSSASSSPITLPPSSTLLVLVNEPVNDTAVFYASLTVTTGPGVSVTYSYTINDTTTVQGTVPPQGSQVLYVPPTAVKLTATSSSFLYIFDGWSGSDPTSTSTGPSGSSLVLAVDGPQTLAATSTYNYSNFGLALGLIIAVGVTLGAAVLLNSRKSRK